MVNKILVNNSDSNYTHSIFDISEYTGRQYSTLTDALDEVPIQKRKGGMTIRYVQTNDNKYVQYRLMSYTFDTNPANWQGVDDEPQLNSKNLVESGGVAEKNQTYDDVVISRPSANIFNKYTAVLNKYVGRDGVERSNGSYFHTDYISIDSQGAYANLGTIGGSYLGYACFDNTKTFTHGANSKQATYQDGDAYVVLSGLKTDIDNFMVVAGTSEDMPTNYEHFGFIGLLKENSVGSEQIKNNSVSGQKLLDNSIPVVKIQKQSILANNVLYDDKVKELFLYDKVINGIDYISITLYEGDLSVRGILNSQMVWGCRNTLPENDKIHTIKCTTAGGNVSIDDIIGYAIVIDRTYSDGNLRTLNLSRALLLSENVNIDLFLKRLAENSIVNNYIKNKEVSIEKLSFSAKEIVSNNLLNTSSAEYKYQKGYYINKNTGNTGNASALTTCYGYTPFIPVSKYGLYCNCFASIGSAGGAVYNASKQYIRSTGKIYTYVEGDAFVRFTLSQYPEAPYLTNQYMVNDGTEPLPYDNYLEKEVIPGSVQGSRENNPIKGKEIAKNTIRTENLYSDVVKSLGAYGVEICTPSIIPIVVGDTLRIYWRSIIKSPNPYIYDVTIVGNYGRSYPRYYEFTPSYANTFTMTIIVRNAAGNVIKKKDVSIKAINHISSPTSNRNVLVLGASLLSDGKVASELNRRLTTVTGDGSPMNPTGLGLNNITFVGRLTGSSQNIHQEATGGWGWKDYATTGNAAYRFYVSGVTQLQEDDIYRDSNSNYEFTIDEINVTNGSGNIRCTFTGSGSIADSGTLTLVNGTGDATITYNSLDLEGGNPFWNFNENSLDFITYANSYCNGAIDLIISNVGYNDFTGRNENEIQDLVDNLVKPFVRAFHTQFPSGKILQNNLTPPSPYGGMAVSYGSRESLMYYNELRKVWKYFELIKAMAADSEFSSYFFVSDTLSGFDSENLYPTGNHTVANRSEQTEIIQTNGLHCLDSGKYTIADSIYEALNEVGL